MTEEQIEEIALKMAAINPNKVSFNSLRGALRFLLGSHLFKSTIFINGKLQEVKIDEAFILSQWAKYTNYCRYHNIEDWYMVGPDKFLNEYNEYLLRNWDLYDSSFNINSLYNGWKE